MKKIFLIVLSLFSLLTANADNPFSPVVAEVKLTKTELVKQDYLNQRVTATENQVGRSLNLEEKNAVLDSIVNNIILKQAAARDGLVITEDMLINVLRSQAGPQGASASAEQIKAAAENQYKSEWSTISKALNEQLTLQEYIKQAGAEDFRNLKITKQEIAEFYEANDTQFVNPEIVKVDHIFFSTANKSLDEANAQKAKAEAALKNLKQGVKNFDQLVQEVSEDRNSAQNGGQLGLIARNDQNILQLLGKNFVEKAFRLPIGEISGVVKSNSGYHIIKVSEKIDKKFLKLSDPISPGNNVTVSKYIENALLQNKMNSAVAPITAKIVKKLREESVIKIKENNIPWK